MSQVTPRMNKFFEIWHMYWINYHNKCRNYHFRKRDEHLDKIRGRSQSTCSDNEMNL